MQWDYLIDDDLIREAADQSQRIVERLHDHPSIAIWSAHNEPFPANKENYGGPLVRAIRAADGTRPVHPASDFNEHAYPGWFGGHVRDYALPPAAPYVTEFGALALPSVAECEAMGATGWPPSGPSWSRVIPEVAPLLDVAGVQLGESLADLVAASQEYQAHVAQTAIESYRRRGINFFHFALLDGWPCVSWSVVSYDRVPKLGYEALTRVAQPILIGADLTRTVISDAWDSGRFPLLGGIWVVNDTRDALPDCRWTATLGGNQIGAGTLDVPADASAAWSEPFVRWPEWVPPELPPGTHPLQLELRDTHGTLLAANQYAISAVHRGLDLGPPTP